MIDIHTLNKKLLPELKDIAKKLAYLAFKN